MKKPYWILNSKPVTHHKFLWPLASSLIRTHNCFRAKGHLEDHPVNFSQNSLWKPRNLSIHSISGGSRKQKFLMFNYFSPHGLLKIGFHTSTGRNTEYKFLFYIRKTSSEMVNSLPKIDEYFIYPGVTEQALKLWSPDQYFSLLHISL